jgi:dTDP-4-dehydrorhamnose 3,5-epimerase
VFVDLLAGQRLLDGVKILEVKKNIDERGFFCEVYRKDWVKEILGEDTIVQTNLSVSYPGMIRAWHKHKLGQVDYFLVLQGSVKICAYDDVKKEISEIISSSERLQLVRIPGFYWHGFKNVGIDRSIVIYFVNTLYNYQDPDEERRPWNDGNIIDGKTGLPFDWNKPPHK